MFALPCSYVPRHAAPREPLAPSTRSALAVGLAAAVLPLGATTAFAESTPATTTVADSSSATATTGTAPEARAPYDAGTPAAAPAAAASAPAAAQPKAKTRAETDLAFRAPASARSAKVPVGIRLTSGGRAVRNGYVRLEKSTPDGWTYVGRLLTNGDGVGTGTLRVAGSAKLRAAYTGSQVRTPAVSAARVVRTAAVDGSAVLEEAAKHVGAPYVYGAVGPDAFDCSGYTRYVYGRLGKSLPHNARAQEQATTRVSKADAQPGDLVFMQDVNGHVGIYAGNGQMYDAPRSGKTVSRRAIWSQNYTVGRVL
ncbi:MAG: hypothetical protein JWM64_1573 [Frankiales bacterium]|nr:hypothetical protein [Frankiales bacterium]